MDLQIIQNKIFEIRGYRVMLDFWKIQCKLPPKTKRFCPLVLK